MNCPAGGQGFDFVHQGSAANVRRRAFSGAAERAYLVLGCLIGAAGGPLQAASRTLLIRMAPKDLIAQYFGLFALTGKVTSFVGPLLIGAITAITASQKAGMAVLVVFFVAGLALLARVREE